MCNIYVFEDRGPQDGVLKEGEKITPSSELLLSASNGRHLRFLSGASRAYVKLCDIRRSEGGSAYYVVFYDVSPNNLSTVNGYRDLVQRTNDWGNITIIPIICIEYYIVRMLRNLGVLQCGETLRPFISYLVNELNWGKFLGSYAEGKYASSYNTLLKEGILPRAIRMLEKSYKYILEKQSCVCLVNSNSATDPDKGLFIGMTVNV